MLNLKKIAITGGVASGKSSVSQVFRELGAYVVNADSIVHELLSPNTPLGRTIVHLFGNDVVTNGEFNRKAISDKVFNDLELLHALERILHPAVLEKIQDQYHKACCQKSYRSFVVEIPLLFEIGGESYFDKIITVLSPIDLCRKRFCEAGYTEEEFERRMKRQWPPSQKAAKADFIIYNTTTLEELRKQVFELDKQLHNH
jgi:dephospho-CoA kinase